MKLITDDGQEFKIEQMRVAELRPDDVVVLQVDALLSESDMKRLSGAMRRIFGDAQKVLILDNDAKLSIKRRTDADN